jgi:hypothetical protein
MGRRGLRSTTRDNRERENRAHATRMARRAQLFLVLRQLGLPDAVALQIVFIALPDGSAEAPIVL